MKVNIFILQNKQGMSLNASVNSLPLNHKLGKMKQSNTSTRKPRECTAQKENQKNAHHPMYMAARFFLLVACMISSSTWPSTDSAMGCFDMNPRSLLRTSSRTPAGVSGTLV